MVEKIKLLSSKARSIGIFHLKETYRILFEWLIAEGYEIEEKFYKEILLSGGNKEVDINWEATKIISDYFKFLITVRFHPVPMTDVEVEIDGIKQKMNKGDFTIEFSCSLIKDYNNQWSSPFAQTMRSIYDKLLVRERQEAYEGKLISEMEALDEQAKAFLSLTGSR